MRYKTFSFFYYLFFILIFACSNTNSIQTIEGVVQSVEFRKDGYTASIKTAKKNYNALISIPNLALNGNYQEFKVGDTVSLKGKVWKIKNQKQLKVTSIN